jgi:hypothetical protein
VNAIASLVDVPELEDALGELLLADGDLAYSNFQPATNRRGALLTFHRERWLAPERAIGFLLARDEEGRPVGAARIDARPFESEHFGLKMALLDRPLATAAPEMRQEALGAIFAAAHEHLRERDYGHIAVRLSSEDGAGAWAIQEQGARHVGTQVSWTCPLDGREEPWPESAGISIEAWDAHALRSVPAGRWKRLSDWSAHGFLRGPFLFDRTLPDHLSRQTYSIWMERVMTGEWADGAMVALDGDEVVAVIAMQLQGLSSKLFGCRIFGRSIAATLPGYSGLCTGLMCKMIATRPFDADYMEGDTPVTTFGTINMFAKVGFKYLRATSTFHRRLDDASRE